MVSKNGKFYVFFRLNCLKLTLGSKALSQQSPLQITIPLWIHLIRAYFPVFFHRCRYEWPHWMSHTPGTYKEFVVQTLPATDRPDAPATKERSKHSCRRGEWNVVGDSPPPIGRTIKIREINKWKNGEALPQVAFAQTEQKWLRIFHSNQTKNQKEIPELEDSIWVYVAPFVEHMLLTYFFVVPRPSAATATTTAAATTKYKWIASE